MQKKGFYRLLWIVRIVLVLAFVVTCFDHRALAGGVFWGYWHSESSIGGYWIPHGYSPTTATIIATLLGNLADINWWAVVFYDLEFFPSVRHFMGKFWNLSPSKEDLEGWRYRLRYAAIPIVSFLPQGGVWASLIIGSFLRLNRWAVLCLVIVGNTMKHFVIGGIFRVLFEHGISRGAIGYATIVVTLTAAIIGLLKLNQKLRQAPLTAFEDE